ncbi:MAG TPA: PQQ-binding-like beta-propeller repeat protein, partial [Planctomycetota bacterium]|nr:PQQ-binding-like beta-propeller repeat protein [Planctomycetota bacterium]
QPVSDGKHVCVFVGNGVVACYDTEGNRRWIRRIPLEEYCYTSSPTIAAGNLVVNCAGIRALDLETGEDKWVNGEASGGVASLVRAVIRNTEVVVTQKGDVLRATDGHLLYANPRKTAADTGWAPATVIGDVVWLPWGAFCLLRFDFSEAAGDTWNARLSDIGDLTLNKTPDGKWVDRWTAAAPLVHDDVAYCFDIFGIFYAVDLKTRKLLYREQLDFDSIDSYVHLGASASPTLGGKYIYVCNNQGTCYVLEPGPTFKVVARNQISTTPRRTRPLPPIEVLANSAPVFEGRFMYWRGEKNLYCIGR